MPKRSRYPAPWAVTHLSIRGAAVATNIVFIGFLAHLASINGEIYPAAYVAAIWAVLGDALEIGVLLNKSRSLPRLSSGGQLTLDFIGLLLLVPGAFLNWYGATYSYESRPPSRDRVEANDWGAICLWAGCASLIIRIILFVMVCVDCCWGRHGPHSWEV